jgi:spore germination protein
LRGRGENREATAALGASGLQTFLAFNGMTKKTLRLRSLIFGIAAMLSAHAGSCALAETAAEIRPHRPHQVWGYQPWWLHANWPAINLGLWDRIIFFEFRVEADGSIGNTRALPAAWRKMGRAAARCGSALDLSFTLFDERKFERLFSSAVSRDVLLRQVASLTEAGHAQGVHLDFEIFGRVSDESVDGFREFVGMLGDHLRQDSPARVLSVFGGVGGAHDLYDAETISKIDFIVVQGYDAHWKEGPTAGSIAPLKGPHRLSWEKSLRHYLDLGAQRARLLFGVPYFGYEWPVTSAATGSATTGDGQEMTYAPVPHAWLPKISISALAQVERHGTSRDPETGSPYYAYRDANGHWKQGWFEDRASLAEKLAFIKQEGLLGAAAFPLGYDAGAFDALLAGAFGKRPDCYAGDAFETGAARHPAESP